MNKTAQKNFSPIAYDPVMEKPEKNEAETLNELLQTMRKIRETTYKDTGHAMRSVHVKSHGILKGEIKILDGLPETLAQGLFGKKATYPLLMRLSTTPGDMLPDKISTPRGCAIKIVGVKGERLPGSEDSVTQNFVMVNGGSTFQAANLKSFLANLKLLAATTDKAEGAKVVVSSIMKTTEKAIEALGGTSAKARNLGGEPEKHILGETFFSQAPLRFGDYIAKISLVPVAPELKALTGQPVDTAENPLAIRHSVIKFFAEHGGEWELRAQLCTDLDKMSIENAHKEWPEKISPYVTVAKVIVPPQQAWSEKRSRIVDDGMFFSPWQGLAAHQPLGSIMRSRKSAYELSAKFRSTRNGKPVAEPTTLDEFE